LVAKALGIQGKGIQPMKGRPHLDASLRLMRFDDDGDPVLSLPKAELLAARGNGVSLDLRSTLMRRGACPRPVV
jgi:hypothetical protein